MDPLEQKHPEMTPYNYVLNNPMGLVDPDGRQVSVNPFTALPYASHYLWTPQQRLRAADEVARMAFEPYDYARTAIDVIRDVTRDEASWSRTGLQVGAASIPLMSGGMGRRAAIEGAQAVLRQQVSSVGSFDQLMGLTARKQLPGGSQLQNVITQGNPREAFEAIANARGLVPQPLRQRGGRAVPGGLRLDIAGASPIILRPATGATRGADNFWTISQGNEKIRFLEFPTP